MNPESRMRITITDALYHEPSPLARQLMDHYDDEAHYYDKRGAIIAAFAWGILTGIVLSAIVVLSVAP